MKIVWKAFKKLIYTQFMMHGQRNVKLYSVMLTNF